MPSSCIALLPLAQPLRDAVYVQMIPIVALGETRLLVRRLWAVSMAVYVRNSFVLEPLAVVSVLEWNLLAHDQEGRPSSPFDGED